MSDRQIFELPELVQTSVFGKVQSAKGIQGIQRYARSMPVAVRDRHKREGIRSGCETTHLFEVSKA